MATVTVTNAIDVAGKYESLVTQSLGGNSAYIRAKETAEDLITGAGMDDVQKAEIIGSLVGGIVNNITSSSMSAAVEWAKIEKEIELEKLRLAWQLDTLEQESLLKAEQVAQVSNATRLAKVESKRVYGTSTFDGAGNILTLADEGKVYEETLLAAANTSKVIQEEALTLQKTVESHAAVHKIVADTYVNHGNYTYTTPTSTGISTVSKQHGDYVTLSDTQQDIAQEQAKGYTYNAWANALTGSASMLGTAIAAEYAQFDPGTTGGDLLDIIKVTATNLKNATAATSSAINAFFFTPQTGVALSAVVESNIITVSGADSAYLISVTDGDYSVNGGAYTSTTGVVYNGDTVKVRQTASASNSITTVAALSIGGFVGNFSVTTL